MCQKADSSFPLEWTVFYPQCVPNFSNISLLHQFLSKRDFFASFAPDGLGFGDVQYIPSHFQLSVSLCSAQWMFIHALSSQLSVDRAFHQSLSARIPTHKQTEAAKQLVQKWEH